MAGGFAASPAMFTIIENTYSKIIRISMTRKPRAAAAQLVKKAAAIESAARTPATPSAYFTAGTAFVASRTISSGLNAGMGL